jgi:hypothetical protein
MYCDSKVGVPRLSLEKATEMDEEESELVGEGRYMSKKQAKQLQRQRFEEDDKDREDEERRRSCKRTGSVLKVRNVGKNKARKAEKSNSRTVKGGAFDAMRKASKQGDKGIVASDSISGEGHSLQASALLPSEDSGSDSSKYSDSDDDSVILEPPAGGIEEEDSNSVAGNDLISTTEDYGDEIEDMLVDEEKDDEDSSDCDMDFTQSKRTKLSPSGFKEEIPKSKATNRDSSSSSGAKNGRLHKSKDKMKNGTGKTSRGGSSKKNKDSGVVDLTRGDDANEITPDSDDDDDSDDDSMDAFVDDSSKRSFSGHKNNTESGSKRLTDFFQGKKNGDRDEGLSSGDVRNLKRKRPRPSSSGKNRDRGSDSDVLEDTDEDIDVRKEIGKLSAKQEGNMDLDDGNRGNKEMMRKDREKEKREERKRKEEEEKDAYDSADDVEIVENPFAAKIDAEHQKMYGTLAPAPAEVFNAFTALPSPQTKEIKPNVFNLSKETIQANNDEKKRQKDFKAFKFFNDTNGFILNDSRPAEEEAVGVVSTIVDRLKGHQKTGVRFLWRNLIHSFKEASKPHSGGGCVLAHCMGLGKTLTTICFTLTLLSAPQITAIKDPILVAEQLEVFVF